MSSETQKKIINLGKALVKEFELETSVDTLGRWIAHYIAGKITILENFDGTKDEREKTEKECFDSILKLWEHRSAYPHGKQPYRNYERIFQTIEKMDPENRQKFYYSNNDFVNTSSDGNSKDVEKWLNIAREVDSSARVILEYAFAQAITYASDESTIVWLENALDDSSPDENRVVKFYISFLTSEIEDDEIEKKKQTIRTRIEKLKKTQEISQEIQAALMEELITLDAESN